MSGKNRNQPDLARADIGIVCSLRIELAAFLDRCEKVKKYTGGDFVFRGGRYDNIRIAVVETGMGYARARRATQALLDAHGPTWVISSGFSGALLPEMEVGNIGMADSIVDTHGHEMTFDLKVTEDREKGLYVGRILTADQMVRTVEERQRLAEQFNSLAVDMESLAVAQVCRELKKDFLAVRTISDDMSADLPPEVLTVVGATGSLRLGAALGALWKRPGSAKDVLSLRGSAMRAADRLATFLDGIVVQLYETIA